VFTREELTFERDLICDFEWVLPDRPLTVEIGTVLEAGYPRRADLWHVDTALYVAGDPAGIAFITLNRRQQSVAETLGFLI